MLLALHCSCFQLAPSAQPLQEPPANRQKIHHCHRIRTLANLGKLEIDMCKSPHPQQEPGAQLRVLTSRTICGVDGLLALAFGLGRLQNNVGCVAESLCCCHLLFEVNQGRLYRIAGKFTPQGPKDPLIEQWSTWKVAVASRRYCNPSME